MGLCSANDTAKSLSMLWLIVCPCCDCVTTCATISSLHFTSAFFGILTSAFPGLNSRFFRYLTTAFSGANYRIFRGLTPTFSGT